MKLIKVEILIKLLVQCTELTEKYQIKKCISECLCLHNNKYIRMEMMLFSKIMNIRDWVRWDSLIMAINIS